MPRTFWQRLSMRQRVNKWIEIGNIASLAMLLKVAAYHEQNEQGNEAVSVRVLASRRFGQGWQKPHSELQVKQREISGNNILAIIRKRGLR